MDLLIFIFEENKYKYIDLSEINNKELKDKQKIEEFLKKNSLILVNSDFIKSFDKNPSLCEINYKFYENTIEIDLGSCNSIKFKTRDNIYKEKKKEF